MSSSLVLDNVVFGLQQAGGISRFWSKIVTSRVDDDATFFIEPRRKKTNVFYPSVPPGRILPDHAIPLRLGRYCNFRRPFFRTRFVFHSSYYRVNTAPRCLNVTTVHDLIFEKFSPGPAVRLHTRQKAQSLRASECVVCVSESTRKDLYDYYPFCKDKQVVVIPNGVDSATAPVDIELAPHLKAILGTRYFLFVGHRGTIKGFDRVHDLLDARGDTLHCVVVGTPFTTAELAQIRSRKHELRITNVGRVNDATLGLLYRSAHLFFFPSRYEGFGIPPLEAMQAGCPVLASNQSSIPEVVGDAGVLFDPHHIPSLEEAAALIERPAIRERVIAAGHARVKLFGWKAVTDRYALLYATLMHG